MRHWNSRHSILLALLLSQAVACGWEADTDWYPAVWSDDGQTIGAMKQNLERKNNIFAYGTRTLTRYNNAQLYTTEVEGDSGLSPVGPTINGRAQELFMMTSAGYALLVHGLDTDNGETWIATRISLPGGETREIDRVVDAPVVLNCVEGTGYGAPRGLIAIPSPDGGVIAMMRNNPDCNGNTGTLRFLDAVSLQQIGEGFAIEIAYSPSQPPAPLSTAWTTDGRFLISDGGIFFGGPATAYSPSGETQQLQNVSPDCFFPPTSSSESNANQESVSISGEDQYSVTPGSGISFGCDL